MARLCLLRRRVHASWKIVLAVGALGGLIFTSAGLMPGGGVIIVLLGLLIFRPVAEIYFSHKCLCPHCGGDVFLEMCQVEQAEGIERGLSCPHCRNDAAALTDQMGIMVEID